MSGRVINVNTEMVCVFFTACLIVGLLIFIITNRQVDGSTNKYFIVYIVVLSLLIIFDIGEEYLGNLTVLNEWRYFTTAMSYILKSVAITIINLLLNSNRTKKYLLWTPPIILAILCLTNKYTHLMFYFEVDDNSFHPASNIFRFAPYIICVICLIMLIVKAISRHKEYSQKVNRLFVFVVIINLIAVIAEVLSFERFILTGTMMIFAVFYYSIINQENEIKTVRKYEQEITNSRIAIMLSQIQPHFLYNSLNAIRYLCKKDPDLAQEAIDNFAIYLRGNIDSIKRDTPIPFFKEKEHIDVYLSLEKMRFEDELNIVWNVQTVDFLIPTLTVQPLVENAVKYGVGKKRGGGTVTISTKEDIDCFEIVVEDDGVGFDENEIKNDNKSHIGIQNIRARLSDMCNGTLIIQTHKGVGTRAIIKIPRKEM